MLTNTAQHLAESPAAEPRASKPTGGKYGRLPNAIAISNELSPEATFLLAYRCLHSDKKSRWGCRHHKMRGAARRDFARKVFQRAIQEAVKAGYLERTRGPEKRPNADARGRGRAVDRLTFDPPDSDYVKVQREDFDGGNLTPKEFTAKLYLGARGDCLSGLWQIQKRLGVTRPTVIKVMKSLSAKGLATNYGTKQNPQWGQPGLKNPTFKKATLKNVALKNGTHLRTTRPSRTISPSRSTKTENAKGLTNKEDGSSGRVGVAATTASSENTRRTDLVAGTAAVLTAAAAPPESAQGSAEDALGERLPFADSVLHEAHLLGVDVEALIDKFCEYEGKNAAKGKRIADRNAYLLKMARDERAKANGVSVDALKGIASPNEWARGDALARAMGTPRMLARGPAPQLPDEPQRQRIAKDLEQAGLVPAEVEQRWLKQRRDGTTRTDYLQFATAMRGNARRPQAQRRAAS